MKLIKIKKHKKILITLAVVAIVAACGGSIYYFGFHQKDNQQNTTEDSDSKTGKKSESDKEAEKKLADNPDKQKNEVTNSDRPVKPSQPEENGKYNIGISMSIGKDLSGKVLNVGGTISATLDSGSCVYHFTNSNGSKINKTTGLLPSPTTTVCSSVDTTSGEFAPGNWSVYIEFTNDNYEGKSDAQSFSI